MSIRVRADRALGLVVVTVEGLVTAADLAERAAPLLEDPAIAVMPTALFDMSGAAKADAPSDVLRDQAREASQRLDPSLGAGAKTAFVATRDEFYGLARMYEMLRSESPREFRVFRDRGEAERWLGLPADYAEGLEDVD